MILICGFQVSCSDFNGYKTYEIDSFPTEYTSKLIDIGNKRPKIIPEKNWIYNYDSSKYLEGKVVGEKSDQDITFSTSNLYVVVNDKKILVEEGNWSYGFVTWSPDGKQFIYQKILYPPVDFPYGDIFLVTINDSNTGIKTKRKIIDSIGYTSFGWGSGNKVLAFSDFYAVYILYLQTLKLNLITGNWQKEIKQYEKNSGYPRWCTGFVWLNNNRELYFSYMPTVTNPDYTLNYKIVFK